MKKRKRRIFLLLLPVLAVFLLWFDFHTYRPHSRTLPAADSGIILSITTYDGDGESTPFVKCFGHTWLSIDNRSGSPVYIKDYELRHGEQLTFSVWAVTRLPGLLFNLEPTYISAHDRYVGRRSLSVPIESTQLKTLEEYMDRRDGWTLGKNCSYWSVHLWNALWWTTRISSRPRRFSTPRSGWKEPSLNLTASRWIKISPGRGTFLPTAAASERSCNYVHE